MVKPSLYLKKENTKLDERGGARPVIPVIPVIPATWGAKAGESLEPRRQSLQ